MVVLEGIDKKKTNLAAHGVSKNVVDYINLKSVIPQKDIELYGFTQNAWNRLAYALLLSERGYACAELIGIKFIEKLASDTLLRFETTSWRHVTKLPGKQGTTKELNSCNLFKCI